jgi:putative membrane protein
MYYRRSFLLAFVGLIMFGAFELAAVTALTLYGVFLGVPYPDRIERVAILGYGAVLWAREVILSATSNSKHLRSFPAASLHPVLGLIGLAVFVPLQPADVVLALIVYAFFFGSAVAYTEIAKRPLLRSFGVDGLKLLRSTLDHYTQPEESGIAELEAFFDSISVAARVRVGGLAFRVAGKVRALFVAPTVHPGPMGYVSGSDLPTKIARDLADLTPNVLVAHGPTTHDENPATTAEIRKVAEAVRQMVTGAVFGSEVGRSCRATYARASALAQAFGDVVLIVASFAPNPTDDIDSATGYAAVQEARLAGARDAVFVDAHNCLVPGVGLTHFGSERSHEIIEAAKAATAEALKAPRGRARIGYASRRGFCTPDQGIGSRGIEALVIESDGQKTAYLLFDGNNMVPGIRDAVRERVAGLVQESEAMTTDNHSVNLTMDGFNAVGAVLDSETILVQAEAAVREAAASLEPAEVAAFVGEISNFRIFGPESASRLTTSINATLAVLRPALYVTLSGAIALGALVILLL